MTSRVLFDTSVLIPALWDGHENHKVCLSWLSRAYVGEFQWGVPAHCLAEVYAGLTAMPCSPKIKPASAWETLDDMALKGHVVELGKKDYQLAIERCARANLSSGIVYDALVVLAAEKFKADVLLTYNKRDFGRLFGKHLSIMKTP